MMSRGNTWATSLLVLDLVAVAALALAISEVQIQVLNRVLHSAMLTTWLGEYERYDFEITMALVAGIAWLARRYRSAFRFVLEFAKPLPRVAVNESQQQRREAIRKVVNFCLGVPVSIFLFCIVGLNSKWQLPFVDDSRRATLLIMAIDLFPALLGIVWLVMANYHRWKVRK
jgi:hypothetical protein